MFIDKTKFKKQWIDLTPNYAVLLLFGNMSVFYSLLK